MNVVIGFVIGIVIGGIVMLIMYAALFLCSRDERTDEIRRAIATAVSSLTPDENGKVDKDTVLRIIRDLRGFY